METRSDSCLSVYGTSESTNLFARVMYLPEARLAPLPQSLSTHSIVTHLCKQQVVQSEYKASSPVGLSCAGDI